MLRRHLNFRQISHRFTSSFTNPSFQDLNGSLIMYWNMIILNPSRFKVEPHLKYWYFCIERVDLLSRRAISHLMAVPKNGGKCELATISLHRSDSLSASGPPASAQRRQVEPNSMWQHQLMRPLHTAYGNSQTKLILNYFKRGSTLNLNGFSVKIFFYIRY